MDTVRQMFSSMGYSELSNDELDIVMKAADLDCDGRISLEDFRSMVAEDSSSFPTDSHKIKDQSKRKTTTQRDRKVGKPIRGNKEKRHVIKYYYHVSSSPQSYQR